eukprot:80630-Amphidinium_carterae.1
MKLDAQGRFKEVKQSMALKADVTDVFRARRAFSRRALAFDQYDLLPYEASESWADFLFNDLLSREPPPNFQRFTLQQLLDSDRQLWSLAAQFLQTRNVLRTGEGVYPIQEPLEKTRADPFLHAVMQPLPYSQKALPASSSGTSTSQNAQSRSRLRQRRQKRRDRVQSLGLNAPLPFLSCFG